MRIWSLHPKYLDAKGLVALWRETLLAKNVLLGNTKGYRNHPQLIRFKATKNPSAAIDKYLAAVYDEACSRGYNFNRDKIDWDFDDVFMDVSSGQMNYETEHLLRKLNKRDKDKYKELVAIKEAEPHPQFKVVDGPVADWEIITKNP